MSAAEYRNKTQFKGSKYHSQKTEVDGRIWDSKKEADYYCQLKLLKLAGEIIDFFPQVNFLINEGYWKGEEWIKPIYYRADFVIIKYNFDILPPCEDVLIEIHEAKGFWSQIAKQKRKLFEKRYPEYKMIII
jgi:hypothetical protein